MWRHFGRLVPRGAVVPRIESPFLCPCSLLSHSVVDKFDREWSTRPPPEETPGKRAEGRKQREMSWLVAKGLSRHNRSKTSFICFQTCRMANRPTWGFVSTPPRARHRARPPAQPTAGAPALVCVCCVGYVCCVCVNVGVTPCSIAQPTAGAPALVCCKVVCVCVLGSRLGVRSHKVDRVVRWESGGGIRSRGPSASATDRRVQDHEEREVRE